MKNAVFTSLAFVSATLLAAASPTVSNVAIAQDAEKNVIVTYDLDEEAIVTVAFSVGGEAVPVPVTVAGDANRIVTAGTGRKVVWNPNLDWPLQSAANVSATVKAWTKDVPPDYMAVRLRDDGTDLKIRYFATSDDVPGGVTNRIYKSDWLLMRRIPAKGIKSRLGNDSTRSMKGDNSQTHLVSFTNDFYMAVYEFTEAQYALVGGSRYAGPFFTGTSYADEHPYIPMTGAFWKNNLRGPVAAADAPQANNARILYQLQTLTGISSFDLPTEAQWEFACRAGTATTLNDGTDGTNSGAGLQNMTRVAWCSYNSGGRAHEVGLLAPNAWGLYDMLGNVGEWSRDSFHEYSATDDHIDPLWSGTDSFCIRGGRYDQGSWDVNSGARNSKAGGWQGSSAQRYDGFRVMCLPPQ